MYFGFAETDEHVPANVIPTLRSALDKAGTRYGLDVFPNSRHGFQFPERDVYETLSRGKLEQDRCHVGPQYKIGSPPSSPRQSPIFALRQTTI